MTLKQIIDSIDQNNTDIRDDRPYLNTLAESLDIYDSIMDDEDRRMKTFMIQANYCTDTWVGLYAWFLDGEFVMTSQQWFRKDSTDFEYLNEDAYKKVRVFIESLIEDDRRYYFDTINMDQEMGDSYTLEHTNDILHDAVLYNGEMVKLHQKSINYFDSSDTWSDAEIEHADGRRETVKCHDLQIKYLQPLKTWSKHKN